MEPIDKVVIVGGGTAGWLAASVIARSMGQQVSIDLIESEAIGTVGVGEATIPPIRLPIAMLGIDENEFLSQTQGTIKLGIQFNDWARKGDSYIHAFGPIGHTLGMLEFYHYWLRGRTQGIAEDLGHYSLNASSALLNKFGQVENAAPGSPASLVHAYHFDATLVARYLRRVSEQLNVRRIEGKIVDALVRGDDGFIESVKLENGKSVAGDLFIDCSGFRGLLIEEVLQSGYQDWSHWLPCDRAVAVQSQSAGALLPYTQATARDAGWQWRIPLQQRVGNGHVYSSAYINDDEASDVLLANLDGKPLTEPRLLKFTTGHRRKFWDRNCVALGLASGFIEPLESTAIHLVQSGVKRLLDLFPDKGFAPEVIDEYNRQSTIEFERVRDFIILHYHANERDDTTFWADRREMSVPDSLTERIELFRSAGLIQEDGRDLFKVDAWLQVMVGQRIMPERYHPMANIPQDGQMQHFFGEIRRVIAHNSAAFPDHQAYIDQHCVASTS
jgi:tryptophan halogenase